MLIIIKLTGTNMGSLCNLCSNANINERTAITPRKKLSFDNELEGNEGNTYRSELKDSPTLVKRLSEIKIQSNMFIRENSKEPGEYYQKISLVGIGGFGSVMKVLHTLTGEYRAMKIIKRSESTLEGSILDEIKILKTLDHPNIIKIYEFFQDEKNLYLITEYCDGGDLFTLLTRGGQLNSFFTERIIRSIMRQVFSALVYLHSKNIIHGDIKLENILVDSENLSSFTKGNSTSLEIKLIDFGCSRKMTTEFKLTELLEGTIYYIAPEVIEYGKIHKKNDLWSCGVLLYILMTGNPPFNGKDDEETYNLIKNGKFTIPKNFYDTASKEVIDLIYQLLEPDMDIRIDAKLALRHKWFKFQTKLQVDLNLKSKVLSNLKNLKTEYKFQQAVQTFIAHNCISKEELKNIRKIFKYLDANGDGRISKEELKKGFKDSKDSITMGDLDLNIIMTIIDHDNSSFIEYEEFLQASIDKKKLLSEENLKQAFSNFDLDGNGNISADEIRSIIGKDIPEEVFVEVLNEVGLSIDSQLNFEDFNKIMGVIVEKK